MNNKEAKFVETVWEHYQTSGRHTLPWRKTHNPYAITVSEMMLQQTQVERVIPKYQLFLKLFPSVKKLAAAPLAEVLIAWQGLGYNRRARLLHHCAQYVVKESKGVFPRTYSELLKLPGIGPYTAGAIMAFAYNQAVPLIETNVRTVYLHHFFSSKVNVTDAEILRLVSRTLPIDNSRLWYAAIMDYGSYLKKKNGNNTTQSISYSKQSKFKGSDRQVRGVILRALSLNPVMTKHQLEGLLPLECSPDQFVYQLGKLQAEHLVEYRNRAFQLPRISQSK